MQTSFRQIPNQPTTVFPEKPAKKTVLRRPKVNIPAGFIVLIFTGLLIAHFLSDDKSQEEYLQELQNRKETGQYLSSGEETDFCELLFLLRDSVSTECVGSLDKINWKNPPKSLDKLGDEWEELPTGKFSKTRKFRHRKYKQIRINFDIGDPNAPSKAHRARDHWHRLNPNSTSDQDYYLDINGEPVPKKSKESHLHTRK